MRISLLVKAMAVLAVVGSTVLAIAMFQATWESTHGLDLLVVAASGVYTIAVGLAAVEAARPAAASHRERLEQLDAVGAAKRERPGVGAGEERVAPEQQTLGAGPDPEQHAVAAVLAQQVGVAVAGEAALALCLEQIELYECRAEAVS